MSTRTSPTQLNMPRYFTTRQTRLATLGFGLLPLIVPLIMMRADVTAWDTILFAGTGIFWILIFSVFAPFTVPSLALGNPYRTQLSAKTRSHRFAVWTRPDSQLRMMFWLNLVSSITAAFWLYQVTATLFS